MQSFNYREIQPKDFNAVIKLANTVHGDGYLDFEKMNNYYQQGIVDDINASFVVYDGDKLIGFRLTFAANNWIIDKWCSDKLWQVPLDQVSYFKCNTVDADYRGHGIGGKLLKLSIEALKSQGATAGVSHLWRQSPGNAAVKYFTKCGGELIKDHPDRWYEESVAGYHCVLCGHNCHCVAAEMIIYF